MINGVFWDDESIDYVWFESVKDYKFDYYIFGIFFGTITGRGSFFLVTFINFITFLDYYFFYGDYIYKSFIDFYILDDVLLDILGL